MNKNMDKEEPSKVFFVVVQVQDQSQVGGMGGNCAATVHS